MRISVITPVYNGANYIEETVLSVLKAAEGYSVEYLVIDDGSTDRTAEILERYSHKIKVIKKNNAGESAAVNTGIINAVGDFILVVSADDPLFTPLIFDGVEDFFEANPSVVGWYPSWQMIDETGAALKVIQVQEYSDERLIGRYLCLPGPGTFIRKSSAVAINGRQEKWRFVGDYDFWLRISRLGTLQKRDGVLAQWRLHEESTSIAKRGIPMMEEQVLVIEEFISRNVLSKRMIRMSRAHAKYFASITAFQFNYMLGVKTLIKAFVIGKFLSHDFNFRTIAYLLFDPLRIRVSKSLKKLSIYNKWETL